MKKTTGHVIRICGLLIEMLGVWGVFSSTGAKTRPGSSFPAAPKSRWRGWPSGSVSCSG